MAHDPDVPGGYQDADIQQAAYERAGAAIGRACEQGFCVHGWTRMTTPVVCLDCGKEWPTEAAWWREHRERLAEVV